MHEGMDESRFDDLVKLLVSRNVMIDPTLVYGAKGIMPQWDTYELQCRRLITDPALTYLPGDIADNWCATRHPAHLQLVATVGGRHASGSFPRRHPTFCAAAVGAATVRTPTFRATTVGQSFRCVPNPGCPTGGVAVGESFGGPVRQCIQWGQ